MKEGRLRYLGHTYATRSASIPGLPAIAESVPGFSADVWYGLLAKAGTPQHILERFSTALFTVLSQPEVVEQYASLGVLAKPGRNELAAILQRENELWGRVVKSRNIRLD